MSEPVVFELDPTVDVMLLCQRYYLMALEETGPLAVGGEPPALARFGRPSERLALWARSALLRRRLPRSRIRADSGHVGRYRVGDRVFMIDGRDSSWIDEELVASADVYFKANAWPELEYPAHLRPIVNGNGILGRGAIRHLRSLRDRDKEIDLVAIVRAWGSEHAVRALEELARVDCSKRIVAVFPCELPADLIGAQRRRLEAAGIECTSRPLRPRALWRELARARLVFARPGRHACFPWRTVDLLAMGACALYDSLPPPRWPVPLEPGRHVASAAIPLPEGGAEMDDSEYAKLGRVIEELLADPDAAATIGRNAAAYFDEHAAPEAVGRYVRRVVAGP